MNNVEKSRIIYSLANVYIFKELYRYSFIKSKSFNLANTPADLQNKIMHVVKSTSNAVINDGNQECINRISFTGNTLSLEVTYIKQNGNELVLEQKLKEVFSLALNANQFLCYSVYRGRISFSLNGIATLMSQRQYGEDENTIDRLNSIVNSIMYVPRAVQIICDVVRYINNFTNDYVYTYEDIYRMLELSGVHNTRNPRLNSALICLRFLYTNNNPVIFEKCDMGEEANSELRKVFGRYSYYTDYDLNEVIRNLCDNINSIGVLNGYVATTEPARQTVDRW